MAAGVGPHGVTGVLSSKGSHLHVSPLVAPQGLWVSHYRQPDRSDPSVAGMHQDGKLVAPGGQVVVRGSSSGPSSIPAVVYRCVTVRLRTALVGSDGLKGLVWGRQCRTLQWARDEGSIAGYLCLPASVVETECRPDGLQPSLVVASLQRQGDTVSRVLCFMASEITMWIERYSVHLSARCILGRQDDVMAGQLSHPDQVLHTGMVPSSEGIWGDLRCVRPSLAHPLSKSSIQQASAV